MMSLPTGVLRRSPMTMSSALVCWATSSTWSPGSRASTCWLTSNSTPESVRSCCTDSHSAEDACRRSTRASPRLALTTTSRRPRSLASSMARLSAARPSGEGTYPTTIGMSDSFLVGVRVERAVIDQGALATGAAAAALAHHAHDRWQQEQERDDEVDDLRERRVPQAAQLAVADLQRPAHLLLGDRAE